jgi:hypothetical protein
MLAAAPDAGEPGSEAIARGGVSSCPQFLFKAPRVSRARASSNFPEQRRAIRPRHAFLPGVDGLRYAARYRSQPACVRCSH